MVVMSTENKRLIKYLGIIFLVALMGYKLPHDTYSIIEYILRPIRYKGGAVYLSGVIPIALIFIAVRRLSDLERFKGRSTLLIFLVVIAIMIPTLKGVLDFGRASYYWVKGDRLQAVDITHGKVSVSGSVKEAHLNFQFELKDYSRGQNEFKVRVYLPEMLREYTGKEYYTFDKIYVTHGNRNSINIYEKMTIKLDDDSVRERLFYSRVYQEDFVYELYNEKEVVKFISRGI